jgi:hypothetical protein
MLRSLSYLSRGRPKGKLPWGKKVPAGAHGTYRWSPRLGSLIALMIAATALASCAGKGMGDYTPTWAGGLPKDAPPRPGLASCSLGGFGCSCIASAIHSRAMSRSIPKLLILRQASKPHALVRVACTYVVDCHDGAPCSSGGSATGLSATDAWAEPLSVMKVFYAHASAQSHSRDSEIKLGRKPCRQANRL